MIPVANRPILFYGLRHLAEAGIEEVAIVLGPIREGIPEQVGDGSAFGLRVTYVEQGPPRGLAHAVLCAREFLADDPFVMYLGDNLLQQGVRPFRELFERERPDAVVGAARVPDPRHYGVVELDGDRIVSIEEKPKVPKSPFALIGVYLFTPSIHPIIEKLSPSARGELEITEAIWKLHEAGRRVDVQRVEGWWKDTGLPEDLLEANQRVLESMPPNGFERLGSVAEGAELTGAVGLGPGSSVGPGCALTGPIVLGRGVKVTDGARIGAFTAVGDGAVVSGAGIDRSIVLEGARIEGPVRLTDSILGRNVTIRARPGPVRDLTLILGDAAQIRL